MLHKLDFVTWHKIKKIKQCDAGRLQRFFFLPSLQFLCGCDRKMKVMMQL